MADQSLPNTESPTVMMLALAWEIVKKAKSGTNLSTSDTEVKNMTNQVIKIYQALSKGELIP